MANSKRKPVTKARKKTSLGAKLRSFVFKAIKYFLIVSIGSVVVFKFVPIPFTWTMLDQKMTSIGNGEDSEINYSWRSYSEISKEMPLAVVAAEDQLFPDHFGFDFNSMQNAFKNNLKGKKVRGASTISQQTAKNVFLWQGRSYVRKVLEVYFTFLIEVVWGKERILEVYINVAEMGKNTFGAEAASQKYFGKSAKDLTRNDAAKLAAILPSPRKWSVTNPGPYVSRRVPKITRQMRALGGTAYLKGLRKF
ncbi:MAG: monofunctional biosynthetic peptidoglycan transglycosylase [Spirosomataceae bacterium]|jgi:monofunctional biosynthetic peptidoglycan transglycosylase